MYSSYTIFPEQITNPLQHQQVILMVYHHHPHKLHDYILLGVKMNAKNHTLV